MPNLGGTIPVGSVVDSTARALGSGVKAAKSSAADTLREMHVRRAIGGFVADHDHLGGPTATHVLPDVPSLQNHLGEHFGEKKEPSDITGANSRLKSE